MNKHYDKYLSENYPILYSDRYGDLTQTAMCWGFDCQNGWFNIINSLSFTLELISKTYGICVVATQVKQKYGGLRFYYNIYPKYDKCYYGVPKKILGSWIPFQLQMRWRDFRWSLDRLTGKYREFKRLSKIVEQLISNAEQTSYNTCEKCGSWADKQTTGYITTVCDKHYKELTNDRK